MSTTWTSTASYTEQEAPIRLNGGLNLTTANFGTGFIEFAITSGGQTEDRLSFVNAANPNVYGALTFVGNVVYMTLEDGTSTLRVGTIDPVKNGQDGEALRINFENATIPGSSPVVNGDFSGPLSTGWTAYTGHIDLGATYVGGYKLPESQNYPGSTPGGDDNDLAGGYDNPIVTIEDGRLRLEESNLGSPGYGVIHGPAVYSDGFLAEAGMVLKFDWEANQIADWYHVVGYLVDKNSNPDSPTVVRALDSYGATGSGTGTVAVPYDSNWMFVFVSGTFDATGGTVLGASMYIDNIRVEEPALTPAVVAGLATQIEYSNSSDNPTTTKTLTMTAQGIEILGVRPTETATTTITVTPVNDPSTLAGDALMRPVNEDEPANPGQTIGSLLASVFGDVDNGDTLGAVAVVGNGDQAAGVGNWTYFDGTSWVAIGAATPGNALVLQSTTLIRFEPVAHYNGETPALSVISLDQTLAASAAAGPYATGDRIDTTSADLTDPESGLSSVPRTITQNIVPVNDLPFFTNTQPTIALTDSVARDSATGTLNAVGALTGTLAVDDIEDSTAPTLSLRGGTSALNGSLQTVWTMQGRYGVLTLNAATRAWTYTPNDWVAINALADGDIATDRFAFLGEDSEGGIGSQELVVTLTGTNDTPVLDALLADSTATNLDPWTYTVPAGAFNDAEGTGLTYTAEVVAVGGVALGSPISIGSSVSGAATAVTSWLTFDEDSRTFSGTPTADWANQDITIRVTATDVEGASVSDTFDLDIANRVPTVASNAPIFVSVDSPREVTEVQVTGALGGETLTINGEVLQFGTAALGVDVAAAVEAAFDSTPSANYTADLNANSVTLTAKVAGDDTTFTDGATVPVTGNSYSVDVLTEGADAVTEVATVTFRALPGVTSVTFDGLTIPLSDPTDATLIARDIATAVDGSGDWNASWDGTSADVTFTARSAGARTDLSAADFVASTTTRIAAPVVTQEGGASTEFDFGTNDVTDILDVRIYFRADDLSQYSGIANPETVSSLSDLAARINTQIAAGMTNPDPDAAAAWAKLSAVVEGNTLKIIDSTGAAAPVVEIFQQVPTGLVPTYGTNAESVSFDLSGITIGDLTRFTLNFDFENDGSYETLSTEFRLNLLETGGELASALQTALRALDGTDTRITVNYSGTTLTITNTTYVIGDPALGDAFAAAAFDGYNATTGKLNPSAGTTPESLRFTLQDADGHTSVTVDGVSVAIDPADTALQIAGKLAAATLPNWTVTNNNNGTVNLVAKVAGTNPGIDGTAFAYTGSLLSGVAVGADGADAVAEVVKLTFGGAFGGSTVTIDGVTTATIGSAVSAADVAAEVLDGNGNGYTGYTVAAGGSSDTVVFTRTDPTDGTDLVVGDGSDTYSGTATPTITTEGGGWSWTIPAGTFVDPDSPLGHVLTAHIVAGNGSTTPLVNSAALSFDAVTGTFSGDGTTRDVVIEVRAADTVDASYSQGIAAVRFQLDVYNDTLTTIVNANVASITGALIDGAGVGTFHVPARAFDLDVPEGTVITWSVDPADMPDWLSFDPATGLFSGNPPAGASNPTIDVTVHAAGQSATVAVTLTVANTNDPLIVVAPYDDVILNAGSALSLTIPAPFRDPDGNADGTATANGITHAVVFAVNGVTVTAASLGLTVTDNGAAGITITGNPVAATAQFDVTITGTETNGGSTAQTSFNVDLRGTGGTAPDIAVYAQNQTAGLTITGTPTQGQTLTATLGSDADGIVGTPRYQWQVEVNGVWVDIGGGRGTTDELVLTQAEVGKNVRALAFYSDAAGFVEQPVSNTLPVANLNDAGSVTLTPSSVAPGSAIRAVIDDADGIAGATPTYQWYRSSNAGATWTAISGATAETYIPQNDDEGLQLRVQVVYTDDLGTVESLTSGSTTVLNIGSSAPIAVADMGSATEAGGVANGAAGSGASGDVFLNDVDANDLAKVGFSVVSARTGFVEGQGAAGTLSGGTITVTGLYGTLSLGQDGLWSYTIDETNAAVQALAPGETLTDSFNYTMQDGEGLRDSAALRITLNGANDSVVASGATASASVNEDTAAVLDLSGIVLTDPDGPRVALRISVDAGTLRAAPIQGLEIRGSDTGVLEIVAESVALLQAWLESDQVSYLSEPNSGAASATVTYDISDEIGDLLDDENVPIGYDFDGIVYRGLGETTAITIAATNDAPLLDANGDIDTDGEAATFEVETIRFLPSASDTEINFDGATLVVTAASTSSEIAEAFAALSFANWDAVLNPDGSVTLTAKTVGARANPVVDDFSDQNGDPSALVLLSSGDDETVIFYARGEAIRIAPELTLSDVDGTHVTSATIRLADGALDNLYAVKFETIRLDAAAVAAAEAAGLVVEQDDEEITITGTGTHAQYQELLRTLTYDNTNPNAYAGSRTVTLSVTDENGVGSDGTVIHTTEALPLVQVGHRILLADGESGAVVARVIDSRTFVASIPLDGSLVAGASVNFGNDVDGLSGSGTIAGPLGAAIDVQVRWAPVVDLDGTTSDSRGNAVTFVEGGAASPIATADASLTDQGGLIHRLIITIENPVDNAGGDYEKLLFSSTTLQDWLAARGVVITGNGTTQITFTADAGVDASTMQVGLRGVTYSNSSATPDATTPRQITAVAIDVDGNLGLPASSEMEIEPINTAPLAVASSVGVTEGVAHVFAVSDFGFSDFDTPANALQSVVIATLPTSGALRLNGNAVTVGQEIAVARIAAGELTYQVNTNQTQSPGASFTFRVRDDGGTDNGGVDLSAAAATMSFTITPTNDAPVLTAGAVRLGAITENAETPATLVNSLFGTAKARVTDEDLGSASGSEAAGTGIAIHQTTLTGVGGGVWQYSIDGGATWLDFGAVSQASALLLRGTDLIKFVGDSENAVTASFGFHAWDGATGTAGSTADVTTRGGSTAFSTASDTVTVSVTAVNDVPVLDLNGAGDGTTGLVEFAPRGPAIALFGPDIAISDADVGDLIVRAVVALPADAIDNLFGTTFETLGTTNAGTSFVHAGGTITLSGNGTGTGGLTGATTLTLTGAATAAAYEAALATLTYINTNPNATQGTRDVSVTITDQSSTQPGQTLTGTATQTVEVRWGAVVDMNGYDDEGLDNYVTFTEGDAAIFASAADAELAIQDGTIRSITVTLVNPQEDVATEYLLMDASAFLSSLGLVVTTDGSGTDAITGARTVTFTAVDPVRGLDSTVFQTALRAVKYVNLSEDFSDVTREVRVTSVSTDDRTGVPASTFINMTPVNDAPVLDPLAGNGTVTEVNQSTATTTSGLSGLMTATDIDSATVDNVDGVDFGVVGGSADPSVTGFDVSLVGNYGTMRVNSQTGAWRYDPLSSAVEALDDGDIVTDTFDLSVTDVEGLTATRAYSVTLNGRDDAPTFGAFAPVSIDETADATGYTSENLSGTLAATDVDANDTLTWSIATATATSETIDSVTYDSVLATPYGDFFLSSTDGQYRFVPDDAAIEALAEGETQTLSLTIRITDGDGDFVTQVLTIGLTGTNDVPVLSISETGSIVEQGPGVAAVETDLSGTVSGTDSEGDAVLFAVTTATVDGEDSGATAEPSTLIAYDTMLATAFGAFHVNATTGAFEFVPDDAAVDALDAGEVVALSFTVQGSDGTGTGSATYALTLTGANDAPVLLVPPQEGGIADDGTLFVKNPLVVEFDEDVAFGTGTVALLNGDGTVETFDVTTGLGDNGGTVTIDGNRLIITPGTALLPESGYYVTIDAGAITDTDATPLDFAGITDPTGLNFVTGRLISVSGIDISDDSGISDTDFLTNVASQTVTATLSQALIAGETLWGSTDGGTTWTDITASATGTDVSWAGATLSGASSLALRVEHGSGNFGDTAEVDYTLDLSAPGRRVTSAKLSSDTGTSSRDYVTAEADQTISGRLNRALFDGERLQGRVDATAEWQDIAVGNGQRNFRWSDVVLTEGDHALEFRVLDEAGNASSFSRDYTLVNDGPTTTVGDVAISNDTGTPGDLVTRISSQTITATLSAPLASGEKLFGSTDGVKWVNLTRQVSGTEVTWRKAVLKEGENTIQFKLQGASGAWSEISTADYVLDRSAPTVTIGTATISDDTGTAGDLVTNLATQTLGAELSRVLGDGETMQLSQDGGATWTDVSASVTGTTMALAGLTLQEGRNTVLLRVIDEAENASAMSTTVITLDTVAPTNGVLDGTIRISNDTDTPNDFITYATGQTITARLASSLSGGERLMGSVDGGTTWQDVTGFVRRNILTWRDAELAVGTDDIVLRVVDVAGNEGPEQAQGYTVLTRMPTTVSIAALDADKLEGTARGTTPFTFSVTLSQAVDWDIALDWVVTPRSGAAFVAGTDDFPGSSLPSGVLRITAGETSATLTVNVGADSFFSQDEAFTVTVSSTESALTFAQDEAHGLIRNDDDLRGTSGKNRLTGSESSEAIYGLAGNDTIAGGSGDDTLSGGRGNDVLTGGAGADAFVFDEAASTKNADTITDFTVGEDMVHLAVSALSGLGSAGGVLDAAAFALGTAPTTADHRVIYDQSTGNLYFDADGTSRKYATILLATLDGAPVLDADDFWLI